MKYSVKSMLTAIMWTLVLCVPAYIAVANYLIIQNSPMDAERVARLDITDVKGNSFALESSDIASGKMIEQFIDLNERATKQTSLPDPLIGQNYFAFDYIAYSGERQSYRYYFTGDPGQAYFVDNKGDAFHIKTEDAEAFLATPYARCLYKTTSFPTMTVSGETIDPNNASWAYEIYNGEYISLDDIKLSSPTEKIYRMNGAFAVSFDDQPDFVSVEVYDGGTLIYNDIYDNIANASLEGKTIDVILNAKWYADEDSSCYGEASYRFKSKILLPAVFYLGETTIDPGEFVVVTARNVEDPSQIKFKSEPDIGYTPKFFADGSVVRALLPVSCEYTGGDVKLSFTYGETTQEMTLGINPKTFKSTSYDIDYVKISQTRTENTMKLFEDAVTPIIKETSETPLWEGSFGEGIAQDILKKKWAYIRTGFGLYRTITNANVTYRHQGVDYAAGRGIEALAVNSGEVVYADYLEYTGYMVIIDHGLGLKSFYCHLDSLVAKVGDKVEKDDLIGMVGSTGFTNSVLLHVGLAVYDVPVCPYDLWENGIIMTE